MRSSQESVPLSQAVGDAVTAAGNVMVDRVEVVRLRWARDIRSTLPAVAYGAAGVVLLLIGLGSASAAALWTLLLWLPPGAAHLVLAVVATTIGALALRTARARLPGRVSGAKKTRPLDSAISPTALEPARGHAHS